MPINILVPCEGTLLIEEDIKVGAAYEKGTLVGTIIRDVADDAPLRQIRMPSDGTIVGIVNNFKRVKKGDVVVALTPVEISK